MFVLFFFFSSRRRHTRSLCDWSSDVCSSDLGVRNRPGKVAGPLGRQAHEAVVAHAVITALELEYLVAARVSARQPQIGRASCRERVEISVGAVSLKKKKRKESRHDSIRRVVS